jgi:DNA (cytosine-5)-methyltransferase 1
MTFGSLFAGIGGFDLGLERAGMVCKWQVEIDPFCNKVLAKHWPGVKRYGDIKTVGKHNLEPIDLICGGFPCQDISSAGKRKGLAGERSGLFYEITRLLCEINPRWVILENVSALLHTGLGEVLRELAEVGYDAQWHCIPASFFNAWHHRDRVWIVCYPKSLGLRGWEISFKINRNLGKKLYSNLSGDWGDDSDTNCIRFKDTQKRQNTLCESSGQVLQRFREWDTEPGILRMVDGIPYQLDRIRTLGNAVVPEIVRIIGTMIMEVER